MRKVMTFLSAFLLGLSGLFMAPTMAMADSGPGSGPTIGYAVGDAVLGTGGSAQHLTFSMIDRSSGDRGTVSYANAAAAVAYEASVMTVRATNTEARFAYTIPSTAPVSVAGLIIVWQVKDSSPDIAAFSVAATPSQALTMVANGFTPSNRYTVSSGGLDTAMMSATGCTATPSATPPSARALVSTRLRGARLRLHDGQRRRLLREPRRGAALPGSDPGRARRVRTGAVRLHHPSRVPRAEWATAGLEGCERDA